MFQTLIHNAFFKQLKATYPELNILPEAIYDPELSFDLDAKSYLVRAIFPDSVNDIIKKQLPNKPYILVVYSREQLQKSKYINEQNFKLLDKNIILGETDKYSIQFVNCTYHYVLISNSSYYLETFEWKFNLRQRKSDYIYQVDFPKSSTSIDIGGKWDLGIDDFYVNKLEKMKRENYGSLVQLGLSYAVDFPIYEIEETALPLIMNTPEFNIYFDSENPQSVP
jgi:hypothetical protein